MAIMIQRLTKKKAQDIAQEFEIASAFNKSQYIGLSQVVHSEQLPYSVVMLFEVEKYKEMGVVPIGVSPAHMPPETPIIIDMRPDGNWSKIDLNTNKYTIYRRTI